MTNFTICQEPGCGRAKGVYEWEHPRYCGFHSDQLYRFIWAAEQRAQAAGITPGELLAREWMHGRQKEALDSKQQEEWEASGDV